MHALTLKQPWAWAITNASKRIENRSWCPPDSLVGQRFALHAGQDWDADGATRLREHHFLEVPTQGTVTAGAIVGTALLLGYMDARNPKAMVAHGDWDAEQWMPTEDPYWIGPVGWMLADVVVLDRVVACRGALGLWQMPGPIDQLVRVLESQSRGVAHL